MELQTISKVSKHFGISTRTLRYYGADRLDFRRQKRPQLFVPPEGEAEAQTGDLPGVFVDENKLHHVKPDFRHYGFTDSTKVRNQN